MTQSFDCDACNGRFKKTEQMVDLGDGRHKALTVEELRAGEMVGLMSRDEYKGVNGEGCELVVWPIRLKISAE